MVSGRDFLGPYRLVRLIRAGQHTQVWEAVESETKERLALKVLLRDHLKNRGELSRLKHEALVGKPLKHKNIIDIYEFNYDFELPFVSMELFHARNLKQDLREQSDRVAHLVPEIITQAAQALEVLNKAGWVHCDIKPDNFLVKDDGMLKLIDFSISQKPKTKLAALLDFSKKVKGTRSYMSPEQIRNQSLDERSDVYSLGCVIFEMLAGRAPYTATTPSELLKKHLTAAVPSLATMNTAVTPELVALIQRMLAKDRERRPTSMYAFLEEFKSLRVYRTGMKPRPPSEMEEEESEEFEMEDDDE